MSDLRAARYLDRRHPAIGREMAFRRKPIRVAGPSDKTPGHYRPDTDDIGQRRIDNRYRRLDLATVRSQTPIDRTQICDEIFCESFTRRVGDVAGLDRIYDPGGCVGFDPARRPTGDQVA